MLAAWLASRAWLVAIGTWDLPFYPAGPLAFDDLKVYAGWLPALSNGTVPTDDMWQYPPASAFFFLIGSVGPSPVLTLMLAILAVDLILTVVLGRASIRAGWLWVAAGVVIGPVLVARFDVVPTLFAVLAVLSAARPAAVGAWAAVGAAMKVWPVLMLFTVTRRSVVSAGAAFALVTTAAFVLSAWALDGVGVFLGGQGSRGLQAEAVAALPFLVANSLGADVDLRYRYGSMEVAADGAGIAAAAATILLVALFAWVLWCWVRGYFERRDPADVGFTVVLFSVLASRVFSPQYSVWLLGIGALCLARRDSLVRVPVVLVGMAALITQVLYPWGYGSLLGGDVLLTLLQVARICLVVVAAGLAGYRVCRRPEPESALRPEADAAG